MERGKFWNSKNVMNTARFIFCILLSAFFWIVGCATPKPVPDPLANWHGSSLANLHSNKAIMEDYQGYIQNLQLLKQGGFVGAVDFFEDGIGQHAVDITIGARGSWLRHILIYDKADKRIKVIVYATGGY